MSAVELEKTLAEMKAKGEKPKFIYLIPDFQNPAGMTMPEARRIEILNIAKKYEIMVVEDSPYRELRFSGKPQRMLYDLDNGEGNVIKMCIRDRIYTVCGSRSFNKTGIVFSTICLVSTVSTYEFCIILIIKSSLLPVTGKNISEDADT